MKHGVLFLIVLMFGCSDLSEKDPVETDDGNNDVLTKDDVRSDENPSQDYCALYEWYDDGVCDEFCQKPDGDCFGDSCDALPGCEPGFEQSTCSPADGNCVEVTECGKTITCSPIECNAEPYCEPGYGFVSTCGDNENCYETHDECSNYHGCVLCESPCPEGMIGVDFCEFSTACVELENVCGELSYCERNADCEAFPTCPEGTDQVEWCDLDNETCSLASECGYAIFCAAIP